MKSLMNPLSLLVNGSEKSREVAQDLEIQTLETYEKFKPPPPAHSFKRMPNFWGREKEKRTIDSILRGDPRWIIINGVRSTGKTALLHEILTDDKYHVIHLDLRVPGFSDLRSFTAELASHLETFLLRISEHQQPQTKDRYKIFEDHATRIKRFRLEGPENLEKKGLQQQAQHSDPNENAKFAAT
ncbi:11542_t:CDS:2, partial [Acaulospora morrowiae]